MPGEISASLARRWPFTLKSSDHTGARHADSREAWEKEEREVCMWNWGLFSRLADARFSLQILSFSWLRKLPD
jgi:hypothetical protein